MTALDRYEDLGKSGKGIAQIIEDGTAGRSRRLKSDGKAVTLVANDF